MDAYTSIGATSGIVSLVGVVCYGAYKLLVHSHCRSACCARPLFDMYINLDEKDGDQVNVLIPKNDVVPVTTK